MAWKSWTHAALLLSTLLTLSTWCGRTARRIHSFAGPFIGYVERINECESDGTWHVSLRLSHYNPMRPYDKQIMWGNMTNTADTLDDTWWAAIWEVQWKSKKSGSPVYRIPTSDLPLDPTLIQIMKSGVASDLTLTSLPITYYVCNPDNYFLTEEPSLYVKSLGYNVH